MARHTSPRGGGMSWREVASGNGFFTWRGWGLCQAWFLLAAPALNSPVSAAAAIAAGGTVNACAVAVIQVRHRRWEPWMTMSLFILVAVVSGLAATAGVELVSSAQPSAIAPAAVWFDYVVGVVAVNAIVGTILAMMKAERARAQEAVQRATALAWSRTQASSERRLLSGAVASALEREVVGPLSQLISEAVEGRAEDVSWRREWSSRMSGPVARSIRDQAHALADFESLPAAEPSRQAPPVPSRRELPLDPRDVPLLWLVGGGVPVFASVVLSEGPSGAPVVLASAFAFAVVVTAGWLVGRRWPPPSARGSWAMVSGFAMAASALALAMWVASPRGPVPSPVSLMADAVSALLAVLGVALVHAHLARWRNIRQASLISGDRDAGALVAEWAAADAAWRRAGELLHSTAQTRAYAIAGALATSRPVSGGDIALVAARSMVDDVIPSILLLLDEQVAPDAIALDHSAGGGLGVSLDVTVRGSLSDGERSEVQAILAEAVMNAVKHGRATSVVCRIDARRRKVRLDVHDDGCGPIGDWSPGLGLGSLDARAQRWRLSERPGGGAQLEVELARRNPRARGMAVAGALAAAIVLVGDPSGAPAEATEAQEVVR